MAPATRSPFFISAALLSRKPSGSPRSLKRGRSPSPDDEAKPTVARREKKKLKLLTIGKPSANRQRLLQLLHRQKKVLAAPLRNAFRKQVLNVVPSSFPSEGSDPVPNSSAKTAEETFSLDFFTPAQETSITEVQKGCQSPTAATANLILPSFDTDIPATTRIANSGQLEKSGTVPIPSSSVNSSSKSDVPLPLLGNLGGNPHEISRDVRSHAKMVVRAGLTKSNNKGWHPYPTDNRGVKKSQFSSKNKFKRRALVQGQKASSGPMVHLGKIELMGSVDTQPSAQPRSSEETKPTDSTLPADPPKSIGQVHLREPTVGNRSSGECESDGSCLHHQHPGAINLGQQSEMYTVDAGFSEPVILCDTNKTLKSITPSVDNSPVEFQNGGVIDESSQSATSSSDLPLQLQIGDLLSPCTDSGADCPLSDENRIPSSSTVHNPDLALSPKYLGDNMRPHYHGATEVVISDSHSPISLNVGPILTPIPHLGNANDDATFGEVAQMIAITDVVPINATQVLSNESDIASFSSHLQPVGAIVQTGNSEIIFPNFLVDNQNLDLDTLNSAVDVVSGLALNKGGIDITPSFLSNGLTPSPPINSPPVHAVDLPATTKASHSAATSEAQGSLTSPASIPLPVTSNFVASVDQNSTSDSISFAHKSQELDSQQMTGPQVAVIQPTERRDVPHQTYETARVIDISRSTGIPMVTDVPRPGHGYPTDARTVDSPQTPQCMDVDMLYVNSSDSDGYTSDLDGNQESSQVLKSATYRRLKAEPYAQCCNGTLAKMVEMLAKTKPSKHRLPKSLRERGQPREYDVTRENNQLNTCVREYSHHLLGQMPWDVPSEGELLAFENGRCTGPTPMSFRLDLASPGLASKWNAQAVEIFTDSFLNEDELAREYSDREAIMSAFTVHLITLQKCHRQPILRAKMTEAELNGERDKQKERAREQRRRGLFRRRINATKDYSADPLLKALVTSFWLYCTPEVMSEDETDSEYDGPADRVGHFIKIMNWRNPDVVNFFRVLDALYFSTRFKGNKWSPGRFPHTRIPSVRLTECDAVPGLPVNFYRPQWLLQLNDMERRKLKTRPAIDLDFSQEILRISARFLHIRHRKQLPIPRDHPALQVITRSTFPSGFPLENILENQEEVFMTRITSTPQHPCIPSATVPGAIQQMDTTACLSQQPVFVPRLTGPTSMHASPPTMPAFARLPIHNSSNSSSEANNMLVTPVMVVGSPEENTSRPQIHLVNQSLDRPPAGASYMVANPSGYGSRDVPMQSGHFVVPQSSNGAPWGHSTPTHINQKQIDRFTLTKHSRRFIKKSIKGKEKAV